MIVKASMFLVVASQPVRPDRTSWRCPAKNRPVTDGTTLLGSSPGESVAVHPKELAAAEAIADRSTQLAIRRPGCLIHGSPPVRTSSGA
jgi:hypothetical protein